MSPDRPPTPCAGQCGRLVSRAGRCPDCLRAFEARRRGNRSLRYCENWWMAFKKRWLGELVAAGIAPVCGATMVDGPRTNPSQCKAAGLLTFASRDGSALHFHHEPSLSEAEQTLRAAILDKNRIVLCCAECHNRATGEAGGRR